MTWDGMKRRADDNGQEPPEVILARVDENIKFIKTGAELVRLQLVEHQKDDVVKFGKIDDSLNNINKTIWRVSGGACVFIFLITAIINWFHK